MSALKRRLASAGAHYFWNPIVRPIAGRLPGAPALLETVGRKSRRPRSTPVGNGLKGDTFWIVVAAAHAYVVSRTTDPVREHPDQAARSLP